MPALLAPVVGQTWHWVTSPSLRLPGSSTCTMLSALPFSQKSWKSSLLKKIKKKKKKAGWKSQGEKCRHVVTKCYYYWGKCRHKGSTGRPCRKEVEMAMEFQSTKCKVVHSGTNHKTFQYYWGSHQLQWWWSISIWVMGWLTIAMLMQLWKKIMQKVRCFKQTQIHTSTSLQSRISLYCCVQFWSLVFKGFKPENVQRSKILGNLWVCRGWGIKNRLSCLTHKTGDWRWGTAYVHSVYLWEVQLFKWKDSTSAR